MTEAALLVVVVPLLRDVVDQPHDVVLHGLPIHALLYLVDTDGASVDRLGNRGVFVDEDKAHSITPWYRVVPTVPMVLIIRGVSRDVT